MTARLVRLRFTHPLATSTAFRMVRLSRLSIAGLFIVCGIGAACYYVKRTGKRGVLPMPSFMPRGIRNNNPTNIKYNQANQWRGQIGSDGVFAVFDKPENGIRATAKLLRRYQDSYQLKTVRDIISRWAPAGKENPHVENYIAHVAKRLGVSATGVQISLKDYPTLIAAMIEFENGQQPYNMNLIYRGVAEA